MPGAPTHYQPLFTMKIRAISAIRISARGIFCCLFFGMLASCGVTRTGTGTVLYDLGPTAAATPYGGLAAGAALAAIELSSTQVPDTLAGVSLWYRLGYANAQQIQPYALARWSMPPAQLFDQRVRERLAQVRPVLSSGELVQAPPPRRAASAPAALPAAPVLHLRLHLLEFSQLFDSPAHSHAQLRLRATLSWRSVTGDRLLGQRNLDIQTPAPSPDAAGGARALAKATDLAIDELLPWVNQLAARPARPE